MQIRPYNRTDLEEMTALMTDLGSPTSVEDMQKRMELIELNPYFYTFVAVLDDKVVGMIGVRLNLTYTSNLLKTQIASLVTKKEYQGQGIGRALLDFIEEWAQQQGSKFIYLTSGASEERQNAHAFYKKRGFEITGYRFVKKF
nr:GNAT family N-acetyltransferase [Paenibacillus sp. FJAT-26967]